MAPWAQGAPSLHLSCGSLLVLLTLHAAAAAHTPQGDAFKAAADRYVRPYLSKGIPSLFMDLRPLYS